MSDKPIVERRTLVDLTLGNLCLHQSEPIMFAWLTGHPNVVRTPDEFYAVRIEIPADASVGDYHEKVRMAIDQMNCYLVGPPPEFMNK